MKKILILLIVLAALVGVAVITQNNKARRLAVAATREKLIDNLDSSAVRKIVLKNGDKAVTLAVVGDQWTVAERSNYPASFSKISKVLQDLIDQKVGKKLTIGKSAWGDVKLQEPGDGDASKAGFLVKLMGEGDAPLKTLVLGADEKVNKVGSQSSPFGDSSNSRLVRVTDDGDTVWEVSNTFTELEPNPPDWLDKKFFDVQKIKVVDVTEPKAEELLENLTQG